MEADGEVRGMGTVRLRPGREFKANTALEARKGQSMRDELASQ